MRPSFCKCASLKLCTPIESRLTGVLIKAWQYSGVREPGLASMVISSGCFIGAMVRTWCRIWSMLWGENKLGVPPPIKMLFMGRSFIRVISRVMFLINCSVYFFSWIWWAAGWELKSQYGHFFVHQGM